MGTKFTTQLRHVTESIYYHRGNRDAGAHAQQCDQGEGTTGGNPINRVWAVSDRQVGWVQERLWACVLVRLREVSLSKQASSWTK